MLPHAGRDSRLCQHLAKEMPLDLVGGFSELFLPVAIMEHPAIPLTSIGTFDITLVSAVVLVTLHLASIQS
jgi:hypothetical protein